MWLFVCDLIGEKVKIGQAFPDDSYVFEEREFALKLSSSLNV